MAMPSRSFRVAGISNGPATARPFDYIPAKSREEQQSEDNSEESEGQKTEVRGEAGVP